MSVYSLNGAMDRIRQVLAWLFEGSGPDQMATSANLVWECPRFQEFIPTVVSVLLIGGQLAILRKVDSLWLGPGSRGASLALALDGGWQRTDDGLRGGR
jgi:hypothetical protein